MYLQCVYLFSEMKCVARVFLKFVIWVCENGSYVEGSRVWSERALVCKYDAGRDDGDDGILIDNFVY